MANSGHNPNGLISYGPNENCTLTPGPQYCPPIVGVYEYRPSLAANTTFIALFGLALVIHVVLGVKYKTWAFLFAVFWGCASELIGYGGRILMWENPFSFPGFLIQICECLPCAIGFWVDVVDFVRRQREQLLMSNRLYHTWSCVLLGSHLPDIVKNVVTHHLEITTRASG